jgi:hypothetical protein
VGEAWIDWEWEGLEMALGRTLGICLNLEDEGESIGSAGRECQCLHLCGGGAGEGDVCGHGVAGVGCVSVSASMPL